MAEQRAAGLDVAVGVVALVAAGASAVALGTGATLLSLLPVVLLGGVGMLLLAMNRLAWFVLVAMVIRSSLDAAKLGPRRAPLGLDPAQALGLVFLACAIVWLLERWRSGEWVRLWWTTRFALAFVAAGALSLIGAEQGVVGLRELSRIAAALVMLVVLNQLVGRGAKPGPYLAALFLAGVVPVGYGLLQLATNAKLRSIGGFNRVESTFTHPNPFAIFCGVLVIMAVAIFRDIPMRWRLPVGLVAVGASVCLVCTYTRGAWLAVVAGLVVVGLKHRPGMLVMGILACFFLYTSVPSIAERINETTKSEQVGTNKPNSLDWRLDYWGDALKESQESRITGLGLKAVAEKSAHGKQPHNDFVRAIVETGALGFLAFTAFVLAALVETSKSAKRAAKGLPRGIAVGAQASVVAFIVFAFSANVISQVVVLWYFVLVVALGMSVAKASEAMPARPSPSEPELVPA